MKALRDRILKLPISIPQKFMVGFIIFCVIPMLVVSAISTSRYRQSIEKSTKDYVMRVSQEFVQRIDEYITEAEGITLTPYLENTIAAHLKNDSYLDAEQYVNAQFRLMQRSDKNNIIYIYNSSGQVYCSSPPKYMRADARQQYEYFKKMAYEADGSTVLLYSPNIVNASGQVNNYITILRAIKDIKNFDKVGLVVIDTNVSIFQKTVKDLDKLTQGQTSIIAEDGEVIYGSEEEAIDQNSILLDGAEKDKGTFEATIDGEDRFCIYSSFTKSNWKMIVSIPKSKLFRSAELTEHFAFSVTIAAAVLAFLFFTLLSYNVTKPLSIFVKLLNEVQNGNFEVRFKTKYNDEITKVGESFNFMVKRIKELINEVYLTNLMYKQAELDALQSQINPHFIYNTLETISMYATIYKVPEIYTFTNTFGNILRYSIKNINDSVALGEEITHVQNYMELLNHRFSGKYKLCTEVDQDILDLKVMKLMLQPLVENSITHGFSSGKGGQIIITAHKSPENVVISVSDNGMGMDQERLEELRRYMAGKDAYFTDGKNHIGLKNIYQRLILYYREAVSINVYSEAGEGTTVEISIKGV